MFHCFVLNVINCLETLAIEWYRKGRKEARKLHIQSLNRELT